MNTSLRAIALATMAMAAAGAHAAVSYPTNSTTGDGEMMLVIFDDSAKVSYTLDLGVFSKEFRANADLTRSAAAPIQGSTGDVSSLLGYSNSWAISGSEFDLFLAASADSSNWRYMVYGGDVVGGSQPHNRSFVTTITSGSVVPAGMQNHSVQNTLNTIASQLDRGVVDRGDAANMDPDVAANGSVFGSAGNGLYAIDLSAWTTNASGFMPWTADNAFGVASEVVYAARATNTSLLSLATSEYFDNDVNRGTFNLVSNGSGGYSLDYTLVAAPVPEPATYASLLAGLAALAFVARRRA